MKYLAPSTAHENGLPDTEATSSEIVVEDISNFGVAVAVCHVREFKHFVYKTRKYRYPWLYTLQL